MSTLICRRRSQRTVVALLSVIATVLALAAMPGLNLPAYGAIDPCGAQGNKISCENSKPGTPQEDWDLDGNAGDSSIQGFATQMSVNVGQKIDFKIDTDASSYEITIFRLGYYDGDGAREITRITPSATLPQHQPQCISDVSTELYDCGNWGISASWNVPSTAVSGVYIARLYRGDEEAASHITFVVRDDSSTSAVVFQTSDTTWQAYNTYGGSDFYVGADHGRAYKISYNRPVLTRSGTGGRDFFMSNEYPAVRFMERNGYDISYISGADTARSGALLKNHKTFLSVGHDEYWSGAARANVEAARDAGVNLAFLSGNEMYWRTRWENSADASQTAYRTLVSYKETWANAKIDPSAEWTGTWRDPRFAPRSQGGGVPENALVGTMYMVNDDDLALTVSAAEGKYRLWRNTSIANLSSGTATLAPHTVGYESNEDVDNGFRPGGLVRLSTTVGPTPQLLQDFGNYLIPGTTTHHLTMYRAGSGALVFSAGSIQWTWGLDEVHDSPYDAEPADVRMQQSMVNLMADMSAQPTTLMSGLVAATKSTDTTGPTVTVSSPAASATIANGASVTATGTATDAGGGRVAGVEVSTDDGATWHPATGTTSWSYTYVQNGIGSTPLKVRAMDDSANIGATATRALTVNCPCSVFGTTTPGTTAVNDGGAVELGLRFSPQSDGFVTGVRFYKGTGNSGSHVGSLWSAGGQKLATVTFTNETATGWQTATFNNPVAVSAGQTYVASYTAPAGHYAMDQYEFSSQGLNATPLSVAGGFGSQPGGVYGNSGTFPNLSYQDSNYFVDVAFTTTDTSPLTVTDRWPLAGSSSVPSTTTVSAKFSKPVTAGSQGLVLKDQAGATVPGTTSYNTTTRVITFTPTAALSGFVTYTATVSGTDSLGNGVNSAKTWSFTTAKPPAAPGVCPCTLFDDVTVPTMLEAAEDDPVTLGVRFSSEQDGAITGVRFYKGTNNIGTHTGTLWTADGGQLATGTFTDESTSGWQTLTFTTPVTIAKNVEYIASYRAPLGRWSATPNAFAASNLSRSPLKVASDAGMYTYGSGAPQTRAASNYLVDPVFQPPAATIAVASQDPAPGAVDVPRGSTIRTWFTNPLQSGYSMTASVGGSPVAGSVALSADGKRLTFTPAAALPRNADVTVSLTGVKSTDGATLPTTTWTFRTADADTVDAPQTMFGSELPQNLEATDDNSPVELGAAFTPAKDGTVTAIRFFKWGGNTGTHTGSVWSASGTRLATVTFTGETASGWQTAKLASPLAVNAGTQYVVSYLAPNGHYAYSQNFFTSPWVSGDLTSPATNNGRYLYGSGGGYPTYTHAASNYFVDVRFVADAPTVAVSSRTPVSGATDVPRTTKPSMTFTAPLQSGWAMTVSSGGSPVAGSAALSGDQKTLTFTPTGSLPADADIQVTITGITGTNGATLPNQSWSFHTAPAQSSTADASLFDGVTPATAAADDSSAVQLGTRFTPSVDGTITAIRFYKGPGNTGTHLGALWNSDGDQMGSDIVFTNETASGWQTAQLPTPVPVVAGRTYMVSYLAPNGHYSVSGAFFNQAWTAGPLTAPAGDNGRYRYGSDIGYLTNSWNSTNYFVDVVFRYATP